MKEYLKTLKMNESRISAIVGGLIITVIAIMVFNYFRNANPGVTTPNSISTESSPSTQETYTVQAGDSLWTIAKEKLGDGMRWSEIRDINKIENSNQLAAGQELLLPTGDTSEVIAATVAPAASTIAQATIKPEPTISATPTTIASPAPETIAEAPQESIVAERIPGTSYTVVKGDSLWSIAERAYGDGSRWMEIAEVNKLDNPQVIHTGNIFVLPR